MNFNGCWMFAWSFISSFRSHVSCAFSFRLINQSNKNVFFSILSNDYCVQMYRKLICCYFDKSKYKYKSVKEFVTCQIFSHSYICMTWPLLTMHVFAWCHKNWSKREYHLVNTDCEKWFESPLATIFIWKILCLKV